MQAPAYSLRSAAASRRAGGPALGGPRPPRSIENDAFVGRPTVTVTRMVEEDDVVVAEGTVRAMKRDGGQLNAVFCDVFLMREARIRRLTSYLVEVK